MIKRRQLFVVLAAIVLLVLPVMRASADVVWEPVDDFYKANRDKCTDMSRYFYTNGFDGCVSMKTEPGARREVATFDNGEILYIGATYNYNGALWGVAEFSHPKSGSWTSGWAPMDQLLVIYDYQAFEEEHGSEFYSTDKRLEVEGDLYTWTWPGSGEIKSSYNEDEDRLSGNPFDTAYKDPDGREWGYIYFLFPWDRDVWICISDPSNPDIPAFNAAPEPVFHKPGDGNQETGSPGDEDIDTTGENNGESAGSENNAGWASLPALIIFSVAGLAIVTIILIWSLWRRK